MVNVYFDFETTGLDPKENSIIDAYFGFEVKGEIVREWSGHIKHVPGRIVEDSALEANKRSRESIDTGIDPADAIRSIKFEFEQFVSTRDAGTKVMLIGYNSLAFDMGFLKEYARLYGWHQSYKYWHWPGIDVAVLAAFHLGDEWRQMRRWRLKEVAERFGLEYDETKAHGAKYDALLTRQLYKKLCELMKKNSP